MVDLLTVTASPGLRHWSRRDGANVEVPSDGRLSWPKPKDLGRTEESSKQCVARGDQLVVEPSL